MTIEIKRIRESMPNGSTVTSGRKNGSIYFECKTEKPVSDDDFEMIKQWQREILGADNISEFYTEEQGKHWFVFLKSINVPVEVIVN